MWFLSVGGDCTVLWSRCSCGAVGAYLASMHSAGCCAAFGGAKPGGSGIAAYEAPHGNFVEDQPWVLPAPKFSPFPMPSWLNLANSSACWVLRGGCCAWAGVGVGAAGGAACPTPLPKLTEVDIMAGSIWVQSENIALFEL